MSRVCLSGERLTQIGICMKEICEFHDYDSGRIELSKNEMKRAITIRYCKCGASREDGLRDRGGDRE